MTGRKKRYRVLTGLSYPTDPEIIRRIQAGEKIPMDQRGLKTVEAGRVVRDIPACSVPWLLQRGAIEEVTNVGTKGQR